MAHGDLIAKLDNGFTVVEGTDSYGSPSYQIHSPHGGRMCSYAIERVALNRARKCKVHADGRVSTALPATCMGH